MNERFTLITGASAGIGRAIAENCAERGMNLILVALPDEKVGEIAFSLVDKYRIHAHFIEIDLTTPDATDFVYQWCKNKSLQVNVLINNAGVGYEGHFSDFNPCFYEKVISLNIMALTLLTRRFLPGLKQQRDAAILNVGSFGGYYPMPYKAVYAASKSYVISFSEALHEELKHTSVNVSLLCPAGVDSFQESSTRIDKIGWIAQAGRLTPKDVAAAAVDGILKRKRRIIPGVVNKFFYYLSRPVPTCVKAWLVHLVLTKFHKRLKSASPEKVGRTTTVKL